MLLTTLYSSVSSDGSSPDDALLLLPGVLVVGCCFGHPSGKGAAPVPARLVPRLAVAPISAVDSTSDASCRGHIGAGQYNNGRRHHCSVLRTH
jgi:hypothetical protein